MLVRATLTAVDAEQGPSSALTTVLAIATGALVANLYDAQPVAASIGSEIGVSPDLAGSVVSMTEIGYGIGLVLLVSLADLAENRRPVHTLGREETTGIDPIESAPLQ